MKNNTKVIILLVLILIAVFTYRTISNKQPQILTNESVLGCYVATIGKDVYSLNVLSQDGQAFQAFLQFKNFQKDSSSGSFEGTYKDGVLKGFYSFQSEGTNSILEVMFKKVGENLVRGYGDMNETGTHFIDVNTVTYDESVVFKASPGDCPEPV